MKYILSIIALMLCLSSFGQSLPYQQVTHSFNSEDDTLIGSVIWDPGDDYKVATTNPSIIFTPQVPIFCNSKNKKAPHHYISRHQAGCPGMGI